MKISLIKMIFRRYRKIMVSLLMIAILACSLMNGLYNSWQSLDVSFREYMSEYGIFDAVITTDITNREDADRIRQTAGVSDVIARLTGAAQIMTSSGELYTAQIISMDKEDILRMHYWQNLKEAAGDYVFYAEWFADHTGISAGDTIRIRTGEDEYRPFTVAAVISVPETLGRTKLNLDVPYPDFGFLYVPVSMLETETEKESDRMVSEWREKETEYLAARDELETSWTEALSELTDARSELERQEKEFGEKQEELNEKIRQLTEGRMELTNGRKELDDAEKSAEEQKMHLEEMLARSQEQLAEFETTTANLKEIRNNLSMLVERLEDAGGRLAVIRNQIARSQGQVSKGLRTLKEGQEIWNDISTAAGKIELPESMREAQKEIEQILKNEGISQNSLKGWISQAESGLYQLEDGRKKVRRGIEQITQTYLPEIRTYLEQTEQGLEEAAEAYDMLRSGIAEMKEGLRSISEFEQEAPEMRKEIDQKLAEVKEGIRQIYSGLEEGENALAEGREQLESKSEEAEATHAEAETKLQNAEKELRDAWDEITGWEGYTSLRNEFLIWFEPWVTDPQAVLKAAADTLNVPVKSSELYKDSSVAATVRKTMDPLWKMSVLVPVLFVGIMMMVLFLFLSILIRQSRQNIGILRALGFSRGDIRRSFCIVFMLMMTLASIIGGGASILLTRYINSFFRAFFYLPRVRQAFNLPLLALTTATVNLVGIGAVVLSSGSLNRIQPAEAMSRPTATAPRIGRVTRKLLQGVKPLSKFSLLSLWRNPFRFFSSAVSMGSAVCIIFGSFSFIVSKDEIIKEVFDYQLRYDAQIVFSEEPEETLEEDIRRMQCVAGAERFRSSKETISHDGKSVRETVIILDPETEMVALKDPQGNPLAYPKEGITLSAVSAKALGVKPGDTVAVGETEITVTGISRQMGMNFQYMPTAEQGRFDRIDQTGWLIRIREGSDDSELIDRVSRADGYVTTMRRSLMRKGYNDLFSQFDLYAWIMVTLCCVVGTFIVVNTGQNNLYEQRVSLSVLRAIGFQHREIARRWFLQSILFFAAALAIGYPAGRIVADISLDILSIPGRHLEYVSSPFQYVWTGIAVFAFLVAGHLITVHSMKKWDLAENTKGRE